MLAPQALFRGLVARALTALQNDSSQTDVATRMWSRGELVTMPLVRKQHTMVDEGSYFVANNNQTGLATGTPAVFTATSPFIVIENHNAPASGLRCYLDYVALVTTAAGSFASAGVNLQFAMVLDPGVFRSGTGGTPIVGHNPNSDIIDSQGGIVLTVGAITATAASAAARTICGLRILRPVVSATVLDVVGEIKILNFGGVEDTLNGNIVVANANQISHPLPPVAVGPGSSLLLYLILNGTTPAAASYAPEIGYWVR